MPDYSSLRALLIRIQDADDKADYDERNRLTFMALGRAAAQGYSVGFRLDPAEPEWPVAFIELPTGQVSWHTPQYPFAWDGHTTVEKNRRIDAYVDGGWR